MTTHGPIESKHRAQMRALANVLGATFEGSGFILFVFPFGDDPHARMNYISNANRADTITAMKEWIARAEGMDVDAPETKQ